MAKFSSAFIQSLTRPSYAGGLFTAGQKIGEAPENIRKSKERRELISLDNQLIDIQTASSEAARLGNVAEVEAQASSLLEQIKSETNQARREALKAAYTEVSGNLVAARSAEQLKGQRSRMLDVGKQVLAGDLSYEDGNVAGVVAARREVMKRLETEENEKVRSKLLSALDGLNEQMKGVDAKKAERNISDLIKAEALYEQLEAKGESRTENENVVMRGVKQRIDQLRQDPETVQAVKERRGQQRLDDLTRDNKIRDALEKQAIAILSSLDPSSDRYKSEKQRLIDNNLGNAVKKVEKAQVEANKAKLEYEKLEDDVRPTPLTKEQRALGEQYGVIFQEGNTKNAILANRELLKSTLREVSKMGTTLALRDVKPLDEPAARAKLNVMLTDLKEQGDLSFAKDVLMTDLEDDLRGLSEEDQQYLVDSILNKTTPEAEQIVLEFVQRKFPESFERTQTELQAEADYAQAIQDIVNDIYESNPELDPSNPVDQAKAMEAANTQLRKSMGVPTASEIFFGQVQEYDQRRGKK
jgi:hypothetical protein